MLGGAAAGTPDVEQLGVADFLLLACDGLWDCMSNQQVRGPPARSSALTDLAALFSSSASLALHGSGLSTTVHMQSAYTMHLPLS
jgi:hypothetical protein